MNFVTITDYESKYFNGLSLLLKTAYNSTISQDLLEEHYVNSSNDIILAVDGEDAVAGCAFLEYRKDYVRPTKWMYVTYVAVDEKLRRMGIGSKLFREIERRAVAEKCAHIEFTSANYRKDAHAFYDSLGYTKKKTTIFIKDM